MLLHKKICKSEIKERFLLTEKHLRDLPFEIKTITKYKCGVHSGYSYLYDEDLVIKVALEKYGSMENIQTLLIAKEKKNKKK